MTQLIDSEVDVTSFYFTAKTKKCFPRRIEFNGRILAWFESGLRCIVGNGSSSFEVFSMTGDDNKEYKLRYEPQQGSWILCGVHAL